MDISVSIRKLTQLFIVLFLALSGGLVYWQVVVADSVSSNPHNNRKCLFQNAAIRGRIFDRNGILLADSKPDSTSGCGYTRHYYDPSLAGLIGYYVPGYEVRGIEKQYDDYLSGRVGSTVLSNTVNKVLHQSPVGNDLYLTIDDRIQKIVDQHFDDPVNVDNHAVYKTDRGSVIVSDPHTGEVLAMVSRPGYDPNKMVQTLSSGKADHLDYYNQMSDPVNQNLLERPLQSVYPPGSIYKTVTLLAGLNSGSTTLNEQFDQTHAIGPVAFKKSDGVPSNVGPSGNNLQWVGDQNRDFTQNAYTLHLPVSTAYGFAHSDNVIYGTIGVKTGAQKWLDLNKQFYVDQTIPFDLPVEKSKVQTGDQPLSDYDLANDAFGQGLDLVTPFQMTLFDNAVANNGNLMRPTLVMAITDHDKNALQTNSPTSLSSPVSAQTATDVRQAMYGVTFCGSGLVEGAQFGASPWGIIAKTGTAQVSNDLKTPAHSWLFTQAPYSVNNPSALPALTIVAMKENGGEGGSQDGPMITAMYNDIFTNVDTYKNLKAPGVAAPTYCCKAQLLQRGPGC
ncbi:penicillin-binding transpeptidase domain-containing protein [Tengunoibacter tsumagoiensis]|uniref:Penicillin-binding protein n=1 Tax=Tengunoibacter tsumagoiensis TaxID=2014871 RepID=A0A401ZWZ9_9CHLR|nr:penicillin-binding transpeptidase domain-containing protein [Tengunoibacter tsumagoiensis]GCE11264.1 penicillin-binding protein [Tengunoibacter tsumagoiensis]